MHKSPAARMTACLFIAYLIGVELFIAYRRDMTMGELSSLPNVGRVLERNLRAVGIDTPEQLRDAGSR
jgi:hypothetical protein